MTDISATSFFRRHAAETIEPAFEPEGGAHPRPALPPEQKDALGHPDFREHRRRSLNLAKNPVPGTVIWRGEAREGDPHEALQHSGVGMHWTVNPDSAFTPHPKRAEHRVFWQGRVDHPEQQAVPRSHPSWNGSNGHSMDHEAEVRLQPGSSVHIDGAYVWHGQGDPQGHPVPMKPERTHPDWKWHPVGQHAQVANHGHISYDLGDSSHSDASAPKPWTGADPHAVVAHEHATGNHYSNYPGHDLDDVDWDAPEEHSDAHSNAIMTDGVVRDGWVKPHELSHEDATNWLRWHPDRAGIEQRHSISRQATVEPDFEHEEIDTGGMKRPTKINLHALDPDTGDRMGTLTYHVPARKADKILIEHLGTEDAHRRKGVGSALMDEMQRRHPGTPIDHGDRTDAGKAWWNGYTDGKKITRGRTMASAQSPEWIAEWGHGSKPCPCCQGQGEHGTGFECYLCDGGMAVGKDTPENYRCDGTLPDGGHGKTASADTLHRGVLVEADPNDLVEAHARGGMPAVHEHIRSLVTGHHGGGLGTHWSSDPAISHQFSQGHGFEGDRESVPHTDIPYQNTMHIPVKMQGRIAPEHHETDPDALDSARVQGHGWHSLNPDRPHERETLVRPGSPVHLTGMQASLPAHPDWVHHVNNALENWEHEDWGYGNKVPHAWQEIGGAGHHTASATPVPDNTKPYEHKHPWLPRDHFFAPTPKGLDERLFDGDHMRPDVRRHILGLINSLWAPRYGDSWQTWARVYLAGSEASHFYGNNDLDVLIGIDHDALNQHVDAFCGEPDAVIDEHLTNELREHLNDDARMLPGPSGETGPWESTFYVNPASYDIRDIKPYAAYDITRDEWAVRPVEVPDDFGPEKLPESTWDVFEALQTLIKAVAELPEGTREREGAALYDYLHTDRHSAFGPDGTGLYDPANVIFKALNAAPGSPLKQLIDWKHAHDGASATDQENAA